MIRRVRKSSNQFSQNNISKIIYLAGVIIDNSKLLQFVEDDYTNIYCHHMTIQYGNLIELPDFLGITFTFNANNLYKDENAIAITGNIDNSTISSIMSRNNQHAHITICTAENIKPVYSNVLIQNSQDVQKINLSIKMQVGAFCIFDNNTKGWLFQL